jgi:hypothetical protein
VDLKYYKMSKVEELRKKYDRVTKVTFEKFVKGDETQTKKYLEYMLKSWTLKIKGYHRIPSAETLINQVKLFDVLLPYNNKNKDIYSSQFHAFYDLVRHNEAFSLIKEEKSFNREEHITIIHEDDDVLFLSPKTFEGSVKYGANTRWCTAGKNSKSTFNGYVSRGCLTYLIDKKNTKPDRYNKIAFFNENSPMIGNIKIYNQTDSSVDESTLMNYWNEELIIKLISHMRLFHKQKSQVEKVTRDVKKFVSTINSFDYENFTKNLSIIQCHETGEFTKIKEEMKKMEEVIKRTIEGGKIFLGN